MNVNDYYYCCQRTHTHYANMYTLKGIHVHTHCTYIHSMYVFMYVCMYTYIHTYIHTYIRYILKPTYCDRGQYSTPHNHVECLHKAYNTCIYIYIYMGIYMGIYIWGYIYI